MATKIEIQRLVEEMEMQSEENLVFIYLEKNEFVYVLAEFLRAAEDVEPSESFEHLPEWQQGQMEIAIDILEHDERYLDIPSRFDINEYEMMKQFCFHSDDPVKEEKLFNAIQGKGAFRRFKDIVYDLGMEEQWYDYRNKCYSEIAIEYCKHYNIPYGE